MIFIHKATFNILCKFFISMFLIPVVKFYTGLFHIPLATVLRCAEVNGGILRWKGLSLNFDRQFPML